MKNFAKQHNYYLLIFAVLVIIVCVSGYWTFSNTTTSFDSAQGKLQQNNTETPEQTNTSSLNHNTTTSPTNSKYQITDNNLTTTTEQHDNTTEQLPITYYKLQATDYQSSLSPTSTAYDLMMLATADSRQPFIFKTKEFAGLGYFVEEINGVKNDPQANKYWIYYINGQSAQVGISNYILKLNDIIEWKYETPNL